MLVIGICGASGSGKSTLAQELMQRHRPMRHGHQP